MKNPINKIRYKRIMELKTNYANDFVLRYAGRYYIFDICEGDMSKIKEYLKTNCNDEEEIAFEYDLYTQIKKLN